MTDRSRCARSRACCGRSSNGASFPARNSRIPAASQRTYAVANDKNTSESKRDLGAAPGGWTEPFPTTHWTEISEMRSGDEPRRDAALAEIAGRYWKPVYSYLRCRGHDVEAAKDLTQSFFYEVVLSRGLVHQAERSKGRFRTFLLTALDRYAVSVHRAEKARHRLPEGGLVRLDSLDKLPEPAHYTTPTEAFDYAWACSLVDEVIAQVGREYHQRGKAVHWELFREKVLRPLVDGSESPSLACLCEKYHISNEAKASNMIITVKRRFQTLLRCRVRQFVSSDAEIDAELHYLMEILCKGRAGSEGKLRIY